LIIKLLESRDILKNPGDLIDILTKIPHKFLKVIFDQLDNIYKASEVPMRDKWEENKDDSIASKRDD